MKSHQLQHMSTQSLFFPKCLSLVKAIKYHCELVIIFLAASKN